MGWDIKRVDIADLLNELEEQIIRYSKYKEVIVGEVVEDIKREIQRRVGN